jgi:hypothetical protein
MCLQDTLGILRRRLVAVVHRVRIQSQARTLSNYICRVLSPPPPPSNPLTEPPPPPSPPATPPPTVPSLPSSQTQLPTSLVEDKDNVLAAAYEYSSSRRGGDGGGKGGARGGPSGGGGGFGKEVLQELPRLARVVVRQLCKSKAGRWVLHTWLRVKLSSSGQGMDDGRVRVIWVN